ncbi:hypothetical protein TNCV_3477801 [Trichonephila clavipes]|nr:hypothetical protein TNCV_3477801 [Trichonephila clavipes]
MAFVRDTERLRKDSSPAAHLLRTKRQRSLSEVVKGGVCSSKKVIVPSYQPRPVGVACFHLLVGDDYLQKHLHRIGVKDLAYCNLCHQGEKDDDYLIVLNFLEDNSMVANFNSFYTSSSIYGATRRLMKDMLKMGVG